MRLNWLSLCVLAALWMTITGNQDFTCKQTNTTITAIARFMNKTFDEIHQPNFTDGHGVMTCLWTLRAKDSNHRIKIVIETLYLNHESDRLYVYNGLNVKESALIGDYGPCSSGKLVLYSTASSMTLSLVSNNNARRGKLKILFKALPKGWIKCKKIPVDTDTCPTSLFLKKITQKSGFLTSPSFPSSHRSLSSARCMWQFFASSDHRWVVNVHWMGIHKDHYKNDMMKCNYNDMIRFKDPNQQSPDVESCGCQKPPVTVSKGKDLFINVKSSPNRYRSGFVLSYHAVSLDDCPKSQSTCRVYQEPFGFNINNQICTDIDEPLHTTPPPTTTPLPTTTPFPTLPPVPTIPTRVYEPGKAKNIEGSLSNATDIQKTQGMAGSDNKRMLDNGISIKCSKHHMIVTIFLDQIEFLRPSSLRLKDKSCSPMLVNQTHVIYVVPLDGCGTYHNSTYDKITYWNQVVGESEENGGNLITRKFHVRLGFDCSYSKRRTLSAVSFSPRRKVVYSSADGRGNFTFMMDMYKSDEYKQTYDYYPVKVNLGQRLYLQIVVKSQSKLAIFADTCMATPSSNPYDDPRYDFIANGCARDDTLRYDYQLSSYQQFSIEAFRFVNTSRHNVFIHCLVHVCMAADNDTVCARGCTERRRNRRAAGGGEEEHELEYLTLGPIALQSKGAPSTKDDMAHHSLIIYVIAGALGIILMVLMAILVVILVKRKRSQQKQDSYYRVTVNQR